MANARAADYGFESPLTHYFELANKRNLTIVQCENIAALPHLDEICREEGIDVIFVGPYDLSTTMGQPGKVGYEYIHEVTDAVIEACRKNGKAAGIFVKDAAEAHFYRDKGYQFIIVGIDVGMYAAACRNTVAKLREG